MTLFHIIVVKHVFHNISAEYEWNELIFYMWNPPMPTRTLIRCKFITINGQASGGIRRNRYARNNTIHRIHSEPILIIFKCWYLGSNRIHQVFNKEIFIFYLNFSKKISLGNTKNKHFHSRISGNLKFRIVMKLINVILFKRSIYLS